MKINMITFLLLLSVTISFAQKSPINEDVISYLENSKIFSNKLIIHGESQSVLKSDVYKAVLAINTGNKYNDNRISMRYFIKTRKQFVSFFSTSEILSSAEFLKNINSKFRLKDEQNGIDFQTILSKFDKESCKNGFFKKDNNWYFVRNKFFDDISGYKVSTDKNGKIIAIEYQSELKEKLPENMLGEGRKTNFTETENIVIPKKDNLFIEDFLMKNTDYKFKADKMNLPENSKISNANFYKCNLSIQEKRKDGIEGTLSYSFLVINNEGKYSKVSNGKEILPTKLFIESISDFTIKSEKEAKLFQDFIDLFHTVSESEQENKRFYQKDNIWIFVREKYFDDFNGFIVKTDKKAKINYIDYCGISDEDILRTRMLDKDFKVDYKFTLIKPQKSKISIKEGENVSIIVTFDETFVNAKGCWISTVFNNKNAGIHASSTMKSPFTDEIPAKVLKKGTHTVEYQLLQNGHTDNPLATVKFTIEVK